MLTEDASLNTPDADYKKVSGAEPLDVRHNITSEREIAYLLSSDKMKDLLLAAKGRHSGSTLEMVCAKLGFNT